MPFGLFKQRDDATKQTEAEAQARQQKDLGLLAQGQLPSRAQERLARTQGGAWSSDLSVDELLAIRSSGFEPVGQVMGASVYHLGWQQRCNGSNQFMTTYTQALYAARQLALSRMAQEAAGLGGQGVVGVRFNLRNIGEPGVGSRTIEFSALGTAIRRTSAPPIARPFTSSVSGQEFAKLLAAGYVPMSLVIAVTALLIHTGWSTQRQLGWFSGNTEVDTYTQAVSSARHQAMNDLRQHLSALGADGAVGSTIGFTVYPRECSWQQNKEDHLVEFLALGTAVARFADVVEQHPTMAIRLDEQPAATATLE